MKWIQTNEEFLNVDQIQRFYIESEDEIFEVYATCQDGNYRIMKTLDRKEADNLILQIINGSFNIIRVSSKCDSCANTITLI